MHNFMPIEAYTLHLMFFCEYQYKISQKPFEICNRYPHPITNSNDVKEENG